MWLNSLRSTNEVSWSHAEQLITNQLINIYADVAQLAEQLICNQQVIGSSPIIGFVPERDSIWTFSSAGRASALQAEGHRFEPYRSHLN